MLQQNPKSVQAQKIGNDGEYKHSALDAAERHY